MDHPRLLGCGAKVCALLRLAEYIGGLKVRLTKLCFIGRVLEFDSPEFRQHVAKYGIKTMPGTRSIIVVDVHQVGSSCGFSVPYYDFKDYRPILNDFFEKKAKKFEEGNEKESMDR